MSGNVEFPATVEVVTHANTRRTCRRCGIFAENQGRGLPKRDFTDRLTLGTGADEIDLRHLWTRPYERRRVDHLSVAPRGPRRRHLRAQGVSVPRWHNGGSAVEIPDTLTKAAAAFTNIDSIITGHSTVMTVADLKGTQSSTATF